MNEMDRAQLIESKCMDWNDWIEMDELVELKWMNWLSWKGWTDWIKLIVLNWLNWNKWNGSCSTDRIEMHGLKWLKGIVKWWMGWENRAIKEDSGQEWLSKWSCTNWNEYNGLWLGFIVMKGIVWIYWTSAATHYDARLYDCCDIHWLPEFIWTSDATLFYSMLRYNYSSNDRRNINYLIPDDDSAALMNWYAAKCIYSPCCGHSTTIL